MIKLELEKVTVTANSKLSETWTVEQQRKPFKKPRRKVIDGMVYTFFGDFTEVHPLELEDELTRLMTEEIERTRND